MDVETGSIIKHSYHESSLEQKPFVTSIPQQPVTELRKPFWPTEGDVLQDAGTARATIAPSRVHPNGTTEGGYAAKHRDQTVLQQHVEYWDTDGDGVIWPQDTYKGCRNFGNYHYLPTSKSQLTDDQ